MKILLGDFNAKVVGEKIFKPTIKNESILQDSNDKGVRIVNFTTSKSFVVKSTMFPRRNIQNTPGHSLMVRLTTRLILIDRRWHSSILDVLSFRVVNCDTDH